MTLRSAALALVAALTVVLAGCTGTLVQYDATPATIPDEALEPYGYVHGSTQAVPLTVPVGLGPVYRNVVVTTQVSGYTKTVGEDTAALAVVSAPNKRVGGQSLNPLAHLSNREAVGWLVEQSERAKGFGGIDDVNGLREVGVQERTVLGQQVEVVTYAGTVERDGTRSDALFHLAVVEHGEDVVLALGVHDATLDEGANVAALVERIEHAEMA